MAEIKNPIPFISKILLAPFALIYGLVTAFRNYLYDRKIWKSVRFDFPVIGVGNLTAGGTGKTPQIEYLIDLLQYRFRVATLSRGYGRNTYGFVMADQNSKAANIGDEPRQFKKKFPDTIVAVCEDRVLGIPKILHHQPEAEVILLDDVFQHRAVRPGLLLLLTEFNHLFTKDHIMPIGWLREAKSNYHRADIIVVTKCPETISLEDRQRTVTEINPFAYQKVYFSTMLYGDLYSFYSNFYNSAETDFLIPLKPNLHKELDVLLVCGIAKHKELKSYLESKVRNVYVREYRDHHRFDLFDLDAIRETFKNLGDTQKIIVTTEKDAARLEEFRDWFSQNKIEIFVQPVRTHFLFNEKDKFDADIISYVETINNKSNPIL